MCFGHSLKAFRLGFFKRSEESTRGQKSPHSVYGTCRNLPATCRQARVTAQAQWILSLTPLKPWFWSTFVQKSSNVSAFCAHFRCRCRFHRMTQLPCSLLLICVECLGSRAQAQARHLASVSLGQSRALPSVSRAGLWREKHWRFSAWPPLVSVLRALALLSLVSNRVGRRCAFPEWPLCNLCKP